MPTIQELQEALAKEPPKEGEQERWSPLRLSPDVMLSETERNVAPLVTRDALLALLAEARATTQLARRTLVVAALALLCSAAGIAITLLSTQ